MTDKTTLQKALLMIQKLKKRLREQEDKLFEPIAIIGMSCRLPHAKNINAFWQCLMDGKNSITAMPEERWNLLQGSHEIAMRKKDCPYYGGYLSNIDEFDAYFFGISPREALRMDPQQRILLEVAYESLEDAGLTMEKIAGSSMGVFCSLYASQYNHIPSKTSDMDALFIPTGSAVSIAANRLSYLFDLRGPSLVLDTACSSSLVAIQLACLNMQAKLCDTALVGGVNINLLPSIHSILSEATMLSPTGQCHTFDADADGYVQGEGAGSIILKPLSKALRDKDRIYAVLTGSAVNQDGKTNGLTAPNGLQQKALLQSAYQAGFKEPEKMSYIECHGTGTFLGDPIELQAIGEVIAPRRDSDKPCWIGSVKTNLGHLEPAAGIIGTIKAALVLKNKQIPPHLNFQNANPHIPLEQYQLKIPEHVEELPRYDDVGIVGVSSFGFGGTNAHLVMRELTAEEQPINSESSEKNEELFTLSAKHHEALDALVEAWCQYLQKNTNIELSAICFNLHTRRSHYSHRLAIIAHSTSDLLQKLQQGHGAQVYKSEKAERSKRSETISQFESLNVTALAELYVNHANIDWQTYEAHRSYVHIDMPLYPWQHKPFWPEFTDTSTAELKPPVYPMRGRFLKSPLATKQFEFVFDTKTLPEVQDSFHVLHAGYYLEMLAFTMQHLSQSIQFSIESLVFSSPIIVTEGKSVQVQLILEVKDDDTYAFCVYSEDGNGNWIKNAAGTVLKRISNQENRIFPITELKNNALVQNDEIFYQRISEMGMPAGDSIRWTQRFWLDHGHIVCELRQAKEKERTEAFILKMHPGIIDACIQTLFMLLDESIKNPFIASQIHHLDVYQSNAIPKYVYTVIKEKSDNNMIIGDWFLLDKNYNIIVQCSGLEMAQLNESLQIDQIIQTKSHFDLDLSLPEELCREQLMTFLTQQIAHIFSMPENDIDVGQSLHELGMDSLMAMAVIRVIEANLKISYSLPDMMKGPSINEIAAQILSEKRKEMNHSSPKEHKKEDTSWIACRQKQDKVKMRLFCFPYGGGGASIFREWQQHVPDTIEVCPIQLPGRENRMDERPLHDLRELIPILVKQIKSFLDVPFAVFGHSFGSLIAFEMARFLRRNNLLQPMNLFVSAYPDPRKPSTSLNNLIRNLQDMNIDLFALKQEEIRNLKEDQLNGLTRVFKDNGIVDYSDERMNRSIIEVLLPIFIGDMNIVKNYVYYDEAPLEADLTVFVGDQDAWVSPDDHWGWKDHSEKNCNFQTFNSGHLFIREHDFMLKIIQVIVEHCSRAMNDLSCRDKKYNNKAFV